MKNGVPKISTPLEGQFILNVSDWEQEECESLGFDNDYIRNLLEEYKKQVENPYVEYYYNEKTNRVSKYTEDARLLDLPYIPHEVKKIIEKENETKLDLNDDEKPKQYRRV